MEQKNTCLIQFSTIKQIIELLDCRSYVIYRYASTQSMIFLFILNFFTIEFQLSYIKTKTSSNFIRQLYPILNLYNQVLKLIIFKYLMANLQFRNISIYLQIQLSLNIFYCNQFLQQQEQNYKILMPANIFSLKKFSLGMIASYMLMSYVQGQQNGRRYLKVNNQIYGSYNGVNGDGNFVIGSHDFIDGNGNGIAGNNVNIMGDGNLVLGDDNIVVTAEYQTKLLEKQAKQAERQKLRQAGKSNYKNVQTSLGTVIVIPWDKPVPEGFRLMKIDQGKQVKDSLQSIMIAYSIIGFQTGKLDGPYYGAKFSQTRGPETGQIFAIFCK